MAFDQASNAFDLLGQAIKPGGSVRLSPDQRTANPKLEVGWGEYRQSLWSSVRALLSRPFGLRKFNNKEFFRDSWVERRIPFMALIAAALWHILIVIFPFPQFAAFTPKRNPSLDNFQLTWSGPINDLPLLEIPGAKPKPTPRGEPDKPLPAEGADAFHPRQRIFTDPANPTHPRQTLINPSAPPEAPKILPALPNIVEMQAAAGPAKPKIEISEEMLKKLRPREHKVASVTEAPLPEVPTIEQKPAEITMQVSPNAPARPKLQLNAGAAPRVAERTQNGDAGPAPEVGAAQQSAVGGNPAALIALSSAPAPPAADVKPPAGNLAAQVSISPEGKKAGVPGGANNSAPASNGGAKGNLESKGGTGEGNGKSAVGVSISGGNPTAKSGVSGSGDAPPKAAAPVPRVLVTRPESHVKDDDGQEKAGPPNFAALAPGTKPEAIFASKKVYTMTVNMANLNSSTGSWVLHFSELHGGTGPRMASPDLSGPVVLKKTDPKYPPSLIDDHVEGQVVLYAVIRRDGMVDGIQLVKGLDEQLDANAMDALSHWKFTPASKQGEPIDLEAIVYIPFHAPTNR